MKRKGWLDLLIVAIASILSNAALADCRLDPREVHFVSDSAARLRATHASFPELFLARESVLNFIISRSSGEYDRVRPSAVGDVADSRPFQYVQNQNS